MPAGERLDVEEGEDGGGLVELERGDFAWRERVSTCSGTMQLPQARQEDGMGCGHALYDFAEDTGSHFVCRHL